MIKLFEKNWKRMDKIENFLKEPSMEKLERLRKSEIMKIGEEACVKCSENYEETWTREKNSRAHGGRKFVRRSSIGKATNGNNKNDTRTNWTGEN